MDLAHTFLVLIFIGTTIFHVIVYSSINLSPVPIPRLDHHVCMPNTIWFTGLGEKIYDSCCLFPSFIFAKIAETCTVGFMDLVLSYLVIICFVLVVQVTF